MSIDDGPNLKNKKKKTEAVGDGPLGDTQRGWKAELEEMAGSRA